MTSSSLVPGPLAKSPLGGSRRAAVSASRVRPARIRNHGGGLSKPSRIPEGLDLALHLVARPGAAIRLIVGGRETTPFFEQAGRFAGRLSSLGSQPRMASVDDEDHMTIVRSLGRPGSVCASHLGDAIAASRS